MELIDFIKRNQYLYHLTDTNNISNILETGQIISTERIVAASDLPNKVDFLSSKRNSHFIIQANGFDYRVRDQQPISIKVLSRSLTHDWTPDQFIYLLNNRVFFWPNLNRLTRHYNKYANENPQIIRVRTDEVFDLNPNIEFCRLNSGATRCNSSWNGNAPERGPETFLTANNYLLPINTVAEVTFPELCILPNEIQIANNPNGAWINQIIYK